MSFYELLLPNFANAATIKNKSTLKLSFSLSLLKAKGTTSALAEQKIKISKNLQFVSLFH